MKILAGGPTRENTSDMFWLHCDGLGAQETADLAVRVWHPRIPDIGGPRWHREKIDNVASARQECMDWAREEFDALLMVDSDVIIGPGVLDAMLAVDAPVVYGVFWTLWPGYKRHLPQVWDTHPYDYRDDTVLKALIAGGNVDVNGGGACTLFRGDAFKSRYHPLLDGLKHAPGMWAGEDRTFALGCEVLGIRQVAVGGLPIVHLYEDEMQTPEALEQAREMVGL